MSAITAWIELGVALTAFAMLLGSSVWWFFKHFLNFPWPRKHTLEFSEMMKYWRNLHPKWKAQCEVFVLRMDPALAPIQSLARFDRAYFTEKACHICLDNMTPTASYWDTLDQPGLPPIPRVAVFCIRINRTWKVKGLTRKREVCIAMLEMEAKS